MTEANGHQTADGDGIDRIGQLVKLAGRRPMPNPAHLASARAAARDEWRRLLKRRTWRTSLWYVTAAMFAGAAIGTAVWLQTREPAAPVPAVEIAALQKVTGTIVVTGADGSPRRVANGSDLRVGDRIETAGDGRAALSMAGASVRLDHDSAAGLDRDGVALARGAVYVDTGVASSQSNLRITTSLGTIRHVGTQFEVRLGGERLRLSVREGTVVVERAGDKWTSHAGERLLVGAGRSVERRALAAFSPDWAWIHDVTQPFLLEGATVPRFLDWVSRELGARWQYQHSAMRQRIDQIVLHGSIENLTPEEALAAVLPTCGLTFALDRDRLLVRDAR